MKKGIGYGLIRLNIAIFTFIILLTSFSLLVDASPYTDQRYDNNSKLMAVSSTSDQSVLDELGQDWEDYVNPDGTHTRIIFMGPKNFWNGSGYEPIYPTIVEETGSFKVEKGIYSVRWSNSNNFKIEKDSYHLIYQGKELSSGKSRRVLSSIKEGRGEKNKNKIKFKDIYPNIDVEYLYYPEKLKENIILNRAPEKPADQSDTLDFSGYIKYSEGLEIWANGIRQSASFSTSEEIEFRAGDKVEFILPPPYIEDASNSMIGGEYSIKRENGKILLSIKVPYDWLMEPERAYPVIVDPVIEIRNSADTYLSQESPDTPFGRENYLEIQSLASKNERVLLRIPAISVSIPNVIITSARLKMYAATTTSNRNLDAYLVNGIWGEYTATWNNQPNHTEKISTMQTTDMTGWTSWIITNGIESTWGFPLFLKFMDSAENSGSKQRQQYYSYEYVVSSGNELDPRIEIIYENQNDCSFNKDVSNTFVDAYYISTPKDCNGFVGYTDKDDYYSFSVKSGSRIDVSLTSPSGADFDLYLYDQDNKEIDRSDTTNPIDSISLAASSTGEWRVRIYRYSGSGTYSLNLAVTEMVQNDCGFGSDASNNFVGANHISSLPKTCTGYLDPFDRDDYYKFYVPSGYTIDASMTPSSGADFDLQLLDPDNNWKIYSDNGPGLMDSVSYLAETSGDWRIRVYYYSGSGTYSLSISVADKTPPVVSISSPVNNAVLTSPSVQVNWAGSDMASGINHYEVQLDGGSWNNKGTGTSHTFNVGQGDHYVNIRAFDNAGNTKIASVYFTAQLILPDLSILPEDITFEKPGGG